MKQQLKVNDCWGWWFWNLMGTWGAFYYPFCFYVFEIFHDKMFKIRKGTLGLVRQCGGKKWEREDVRNGRVHGNKRNTKKKTVNYQSQVLLGVLPIVDAHRQKSSLNKWCLTVRKNKHQGRGMPFSLVYQPYFALNRNPFFVLVVVEQTNFVYDNMHLW